MSILRGRFPDRQIVAARNLRRVRLHPRLPVTENLERRENTPDLIRHSITMPAPTALRREQDAPPADIPLAKPEIAGDEDIVLDPSAAFPEEAMAVDAEPEESEDVIDEEGRPKFAPAQDLVRSPPSPSHVSQRSTSDKLPSPQPPASRTARSASRLTA